MYREQPPSTVRWYLKKHLSHESAGLRRTIRFHEQKLVNQMVQKNMWGKDINQSSIWLPFHQMNKIKFAMPLFQNYKNQYLPVVSLPSNLPCSSPFLAVKSQRDRHCLLHCLGYCHPHACTIKTRTLDGRRNINIPGGCPSNKFQSIPKNVLYIYAHT